MRRSAHIALVLLIPAFLAGGCKKKGPKDNEPPPAGPEVRLQITSIAPASVAPNVAAEATVYGSAFESGAKVSFQGPSEVAATDVRVSSGNTLALTIPPLALGTWDVLVQNPDGTTATLRGGLSVRPQDASCRNVVVNFALDSASLDSGARGTLDAQMACFQASAAQIRVEGHCDERGTTDYNLALGQRRADTVRKYLVTGGVSAGRITTTSYGEERPVDAGRSESAWAANRRVEILAGE
jgi:peptidoglycan-associated lipoprotein